MSWAMLRTARIAHLLGWAESSGVEAVIEAVPSAVEAVEVENVTPSGDVPSTSYRNVARKAEECPPFSARVVS
jgi:hypothetical protein